MPCRYGMPRRHRATAPSLFRRGRGGGKPDSRGRAKAAHGELLNIEIRVSSDHSITLAEHLQRGMLDIAFLRREQKPDLEYK
jgi:hypothetical protein